MNNSNNPMMMVNITSPTSSDLRISPVSPDGYDSFRPTFDNTSDISTGNVQPITTIRPTHHNRRKKRTKMMRFHNAKPVFGLNVASSSQSVVIAKKKPDPSAPKITRPCTECGKRFWSWKALFGHMRCHPERPWRGINPPPNVLHHPPLRDLASVTTEEDEYVATCLLTLANTPTEAVQIAVPEPRSGCSSCKNVFGSHQALGHGVSRKKRKIEDGEFETSYDRNVVEVSRQHKCGICFKIFSSGQALGGHKRRHWEKDDSVAPTEPFKFDLNIPPDDDSTCSSSDLDLRLNL